MKNFLLITFCFCAALHSSAQNTADNNEEKSRPESRPISGSRLLDVLTEVETTRIKSDVTMQEVTSDISTRLQNLDTERLHALSDRLRSNDDEEQRLIRMLNDLNAGLSPSLGNWKSENLPSGPIDPEALARETGLTLKARGDLERRRLELNRRHQAPPLPVKREEPITLFNSALLETKLNLPELPPEPPPSRPTGPNPLGARLGHASFLAKDFAAATRFFSTAPANDMTPSNRWEWARAHEELGEYDSAIEVLKSLEEDNSLDEFWRKRSAGLRSFLEKEAGIRGLLKK